MFVSATQLFEKFTKVEIVLFLTTFAQLAVGFYALNFSSPIGLAFLISFADPPQFPQIQLRIQAFGFVD